MRRVALEVKALLEELGLRGWPKTSGSRGMHVNVRIEPRWTFTEVRRAALALSRAIERRAPALATSKWWKEERHGVFLDYNQNAKDRTTCSAYSVRPLPDARVSTPLDWDEVPDCEPADFTVLDRARALRRASAIRTRTWTRAPGSLEALLELAARDEAAGLGDAPWPPHFRKMEGEAPRVAPSRAQEAGAQAAKKAPRAKMPLIVVANSPDKEAALAGLERWKAQHPEAAALPRRRRRAGRLDARPLVDLDAHPREPAPRARRRSGRRRKRPIPTTIRRANGASMRARRKRARAATQRPSAKIAVSSCGGTTSSCA